MSVLSSVLRPVLQPVIGSMFDASAGGPTRFRGLDLDFAQGRYALNGPYQPTFPAGWSFSRTGAGTAQRVDGALVPFASSVPRVADLGFLEEEQRTNKVIVRNANPDSTTGYSPVSGTTVSIVNDAIALAAAGLNGVCSLGTVLRIDNSQNSSIGYVSVFGMAGNSNDHIGSAYIRGGSGYIGSSIWSGSGGIPSGHVAYAPSNAYRRIVSGSLVMVSARTLRVFVDPGQIVFLSLAQLEEGAFATSPIVTEGAAATRGADMASITVPAGVSTFTAQYGNGQTATGAVTPGQTFEISASNRPWFNGYLQRLVMQ